MQASTNDAVAKRQRTTQFIDLPDEILLHILAYLDLPELSGLARISHSLALLTSDPVLHFQRLWIVSPSRVNHNLFGRSSDGHLLRPTVGDLVQRGVMKGLSIERRWRRGLYLYSLDSIIQYENGLALCKRHAQHILSDQLRRRGKVDIVKSQNVVGTYVPSRVAASPRALQVASRSSVVGTSVATASNSPAILGPSKLKPAVSSLSPFKAYLLNLHSTHILPDIESSSPSIARSLLPTMRKLKWCLQRDNLAREFKNSGRAMGGFGTWLEGRGKEKENKENMDVDVDETRRTRKRVFVDDERLRLAVCPDMKKRVGFYETLG